MGLRAFIERSGLLDFGERVNYLIPNDIYYAHLSIYRYAMEFARGKTVLDAGSGEGYGSFYMANAGAEFIQGVEISPAAVSLSMRRFSAPNLKFQEMDIQNLSALEDDSVDFIVSSNALEHVPNPWSALQGFARLLKPDGLFMLAVPSITDEELKLRNLAIPYHLNIWSPRQWQYAVNRFFKSVEVYRHWFKDEKAHHGFGVNSTHATLSDNDFMFERVQTVGLPPTITLIIIARNPLGDSEIERKPKFVDDSFTRTPVKSTWVLLWRHLYGIYLRGKMDGYANLLRRGVLKTLSRLRTRH